MGGHSTIKAAKTVMEMAEVALTAVECCHKHHLLEHHDSQPHTPSEEEELELLRSENRRLKSLLQENLKLLQNLSDSPCLLPDCPPDLHDRLMALLDSTNFLNQLKSLQQMSADGGGCKFPFKEASETDLETAEILINVSSGEPSWWVWVSDEMVPSNVEEKSKIDSENYVVVSEESVVDGVANFMAKCVVSNPNAQKFTPEELQKSMFAIGFKLALSNEHYVGLDPIYSSSCHCMDQFSCFRALALTKALGGTSKFETMLDIWHAGAMFYTLSTWGLALIGLYKTRALLKVAAIGVHKSSKLVLKAM